MTVKSEVREALNNANANGYLGDLLNMTVEEMYVDLCDCCDGIIHHDDNLVKDAIKEWRAEHIKDPT